MHCQRKKESKYKKKLNQLFVLHSERCSKCDTSSSIIESKDPNLLQTLHRKKMSPQTHHMNIYTDQPLSSVSYAHSTKLNGNICG